MIGTLMRRWQAELLRRPFRPLAPLALLALAPKCLACLLAYVGLGAALGLRTPEICGAAAGRGLWALPLAGAALGTAGFVAWRRRLRLPGMQPLPGPGGNKHRLHQGRGSRRRAGPSCPSPGSPEYPAG